MARERQPTGRRFALGADVLLELPAELLQEAEGRHRGPLAEGADGVAHDVVSDLAQPIELLHRGFAGDDAVHDPEDPGAAFATRRALAAGFVAIEAHEVVHREYGASLGAENDGAAGAEHRAEGAERVDAHRHVEDALPVPGEERALLV